MNERGTRTSRVDWPQRLDAEIRLFQASAVISRPFRKTLMPQMVITTTLGSCQPAGNL